MGLLLAHVSRTRLKRATRQWREQLADLPSGVGPDLATSQGLGDLLRVLAAPAPLPPVVRAASPTDIALHSLAGNLVATAKLGMSEEDAASAVRALAPTVAVVEDAALVILALAAARRWQLSLWDALIVEAGRRAGATTLFTEDLQHRMDFDGVIVENPFADQ